MHHRSTSACSNTAPFPTGASDGALPGTWPAHGCGCPLWCSSEWALLCFPQNIQVAALVSLRGTKDRGKQTHITLTILRNSSADSYSVPILRLRFRCCRRTSLNSRNTISSSTRLRSAPAFAIDLSARRSAFLQFWNRRFSYRRTRTCSTSCSRST